MLKDLVASALFPNEISAMLKLKFGGYVKKSPTESLETLASSLSDIDFCYATLAKVSRSFAVVIQQLPQCLKDPVCIFYLVLRGLDSVEDDMDFPDEPKLVLLRDFHKKLLETDWRIEGVGDAEDYRILLKHFDKVLRVFKGLERKYQTVIIEITKRMGEGMAEYVGKIGSIESVTSYNLYCHYVAGLVGYGLSRLFSLSLLESKELQLEEKISNSMGLLLQKTNIIRDYLEDLEAGRTWWPKEIWANYGDKLSVFAQQPFAENSLNCLNHMVFDALSHVPDSLDYLSKLKDPQIFEFCAIPQVMAIATLAEVYNNPLVFQRNVKIRKGLSAKIMLSSTSLASIHESFGFFASKMKQKLPQNSLPITLKTKVLLEKTEELCKKSADEKKIIPSKIMRTCNVLAWVCFCLVSVYILSRLRTRGQVLNEDLDELTSSTWLMRPGMDLIAVLTCFTSVGYLFGFFGLSYIQ